MEKRIEISNNRLIDLTYEEDLRRMVIRESITNDGDVVKEYVMYMGNNYEFIGHINNFYTDRVNFLIREGHPLYIPFLNLLGDKGQLIIDDDNSNYIEVKYLQINRFNKDIILEFTNLLLNSSIGDDKYDYDRFAVTVKNDYNSKISMKDKLRFKSFFRDVFASIEEYDKDQKKLKKDIKKLVIIN